MTSDNDQGRVAVNLMGFARVLRRAGLPVGPGRMLQAVAATETVGLANRDDFYWALHAVFVNRQDQRELFDQAFHIFWRNPKLLERMAGLTIPAPVDENPADGREISRRVAEAMTETAAATQDSGEAETEFDASLTWSQGETLRDKDFEQMSSAEIYEARAAIARMRLPIMDVPTRRWRPDPAGARADMRASLRAAMRSGGDIIPLRKRKQQRRHPPLVILCDISGSMEVYSRLFLHFMHAITNDRDRVHTFLFGTRLTNITRYLRHRDVDLALDRVSGAVQDWAGGTRIGQCLHDFNRDWSRRVLGQGAVVLLISDGLDRDAGAGLGVEMQRLHKSCRRLIWLNPLLRYDAFEPRSLGVRAIMPHVDEFRPVHNLDSLRNLTDALGRQGGRRMGSMAKWLEKVA
ncbi:MAG: VWA domain-containing protein [Proteobacteria bacterium]|nr:VWA domain-containing protein [Pseudomonadota bacterium]